jgi:hypothetical protein
MTKDTDIEIKILKSKEIWWNYLLSRHDKFSPNIRLDVLNQLKHIFFEEESFWWIYS